MDKQQIFDFMNATVGFYLATAEGDKPHVRGMMLYRADKDGIVFHTGAFKELYRQVASNKNVELCFHNPQKGIQLRVSGELEIVGDNALKEEISSHPSRYFLQGWKNSVPKEEFYKSFIVMRLKGGTATVWTMENNFAPKEYIQL